MFAEQKSVAVFAIGHPHWPWPGGTGVPKHCSFW